MFHAARVMAIEPRSMRTMCRHALEAGIVLPGARGVNSHPFTRSEVKRLIESIALYIATGKSTRIPGLHIAITWDDGSLTIRRTMGVGVSVFVSASMVDELSRDAI